MAQGFAENGRIGIRASRKGRIGCAKISTKRRLPEDDFKRAEKEFKKLTDDMVRPNHSSSECKGI